MECTVSYEDIMFKIKPQKRFNSVKIPISTKEIEKIGQETSSPNTPGRYGFQKTLHHATKEQTLPKPHKSFQNTKNGANVPKPCMKQVYQLYLNLIKVAN